MDVMQMDAFAEIKNYAGRVCIVHGTKDKIVDVSYAKRAAEAYKSTMPIAPQNSGLSDMKLFVFNRFCNTFFKNVFSGRWNSPPWLATKPKNRIIFKAFALFWAEAFLHI